MKRNQIRLRYFNLLSILPGPLSLLRIFMVWLFGDLKFFLSMSSSSWVQSHPSLFWWSSKYCTKSYLFFDSWSKTAVIWFLGSPYSFASYEMNWSVVLVSPARPLIGCSL